MNFKELLRLAQTGDDGATEVLLEQYRPLLRQMSKVDGIFNEDLYQEQCVRFMIALKHFRLPEEGTLQ